MHTSAPLPPSMGHDALQSIPPAAQVLDAAGAIALMDDSSELYCAIAQAYLQELAQLPELAQTALQQADLSEATRTLHTFKGLSLTVGAKQLSEVCRQCEQQLRTLQQTGQPLSEATHHSMVRLLNQVVQQTQQALQRVLAEFTLPGLQHASTQVPTPTDPSADAVHDLQVLRGLLEQSDLQALDQYATLHARHTGLQGRLQSLDGAVKAFDFAQAVVQCNELIRSLGAP